MKAKKILALLLALAMVLTLAACGGGESSSESGNSSSQVSDSSNEDSSSEGSSEDSSSEGSGSEPITADTTFRLAINRWSEAWGTDFTEVSVLKEAAEATGVAIQWDVYYNADWSEQKSLLLAGGSLPDGFFGSNALTDSDVATNKASFVDLTDLINEENMPNLTRIFGEDSQMKALCTDADGKIYTLPKKLPKRPITANQMFINQDFLKALNMEMPETYEDLANFMIACGTKDPDGNGEADTYGQTSVASALNDMNNLLLPFGVQTSRAGNYMGLDESGKPYFIPTSEKFKEATKWANYLFTNGGLDQERFTQDSSLSESKIQAEGGSKVGVIWQWSQDAETGPNAAQFKVCQAVKGPDGQRYVETDPTYLNYGRNELIITTSCSDPAKLLQWADYFYDDLVSIQTFWGSIGDGKIVEKDGKYEVLVPDDGSSLDASSWIFSFRDHGPSYMADSFGDNVILPEGQGDGAKLADNEVDINNVHDVFPVCSYSDADLSTLTLLTTDIYNYVSTTYADWVTNGGIDEGWDAYVQQLEAMGLPQVVEIQTKAYENFKNS